MEFLFAPMEGITLLRFRQIHHAMFPGISAYYTPFLAPDSHGGFKSKFLRELTMDSESFRVIPQLLVNNADAFCVTAERLCELGFREINLNAGCPSGTVFSKHKGAGLLADPTALDGLLEQIFSHVEKTGYSVSIKTRMGVHSTGEFPAILEVYQKYPLKNLIIHARSRDDFYKGKADLPAFAALTSGCRFPVIYNGDVATAKDLERVYAAAPWTGCVMVGRAAVTNPACIRVLQGGGQLQLEELREFHDSLVEACRSDGLSPAYTVERMKTLWAYMQALFPEGKREVKAMMKARNLEGYQSAVQALLDSGTFRPNTGGGAESKAKLEK